VNPRNAAQVTHSFADIVRFRLLMIAAGHEDAVDANTLRGDPMFEMALDATPSQCDLRSQSTISRLENLPRRAFVRMGRAMIDLCCASFASAAERITIDLDDTLMVSLSNHRRRPRRPAIGAFQRSLTRSSSSQGEASQNGRRPRGGEAGNRRLPPAGARIGRAGRIRNVKETPV